MFGHSLCVRIWQDAYETHEHHQCPKTATRYLSIVNELMGAGRVPRGAVATVTIRAKGGIVELLPVESDSKGEEFRHMIHGIIV